MYMGFFVRTYMRVCKKMVIYLGKKTPQRRKERKYTWRKNARISRSRNDCKYTWEKTARISCHNFETNGSSYLQRRPVLVVNVMGCYSTESELARQDSRAHVQQLTIFSTTRGMLRTSCHTWRKHYNYLIIRKIVSKFASPNANLRDLRLACFCALYGFFVIMNYLAFCLSIWSFIQILLEFCPSG